MFEFKKIKYHIALYLSFIGRIYQIEIPLNYTSKINVAESQQ